MFKELELLEFPLKSIQVGIATSADREVSQQSIVKPGALGEEFVCISVSNA